MAKKQSTFIYHHGVFQHRNARGSDLRRQVDKLARDLTSTELGIILKSWEERVKNERNPKLKLEYEMCCGIIRDYRDFKRHYRLIERDNRIEERRDTMYSQDESRIITKDEHGTIVDEGN